MVREPERLAAMSFGFRAASVESFEVGPAGREIRDYEFGTSGNSKVGLPVGEVTSAISLVMQPVPGKLSLFAAMWLATWVAVASRTA